MDCTDSSEKDQSLQNVPLVYDARFGIWQQGSVSAPIIRVRLTQIKNYKQAQGN